jgi:sugar/nucleoside kinase (ribokinase family)
MDVVLNEAKKSPIVIGTGLITLDIIINQNTQLPPQVCAGGTCGNVLAILGYLGWKSYPVSRLNKNALAVRVIEDLVKWGVKTEFIHLPPTADAPIIVQEIKQNSRGESYHKFSWTCPKCGAWLPPYKPVLANTINEVFDTLPTPQVFFFDRVSRGVLTLAEKFSSAGAIIFFEPSGISDVKLFKEALELSHIVKYAEDRGANFKDVISAAKPLVEIETLGGKGLRYKTSIDFSSKRTWNFIPAFSTKVFDTAGAGDWCTSGIIHSLGRKGFTGLKSTSEKAFAESLRMGQVMASWACGFEGPRGGMYQSTKKDFNGFVTSTLKNNKLSDEKITVRSHPRLKQEISCPSCQ